MTRPHQVGASVFPRPDQVPAGLLSLGRHPHLGQLPDVQQPGQAFGVPPVGLDPIPWRAFQLGRRHHYTSHPGRLQRPGQPEPGRTSLIGHGHRAGQRINPADHRQRGGGQPLRPQLPVALSSTPATTDQACASKPTDVRSHAIRRLP